MNILISVICFINRDKPGAEIYATFAKRTIDDVMTKTDSDIMITTNEAFMFAEDVEKWGDRVIVREDKLENHRLVVGAFNQLLKFFSIKNIDSKYDWVLYLDCDAGLNKPWDKEIVENKILEWESNGYDMLATRTNAVLLNELKEHEDRIKIHNEELNKGNDQHYANPQLFSGKFRFYEVSSENGPFDWFDAKLPSEHIFLIKNDEKLNKMAEIFEDFCFKFETQGPYPVTVDMEAFEIGVSAKMAGYNMGDMEQWGEKYILNVGFNKNNIEKVKY